MNPSSHPLFGIGLRSPHYSLARESKLKVDWLEVITENYLGLQFKSLQTPALSRLLKVRENYPVSLHGVGMNLGCIDGLNTQYLKRLKDLVECIDPIFVSDHLCWTTYNNRNFHDLLPLPYNDESLRLLEKNIQTAQNYLQRPLLIENLSSYVEFKESKYTEWDFLNKLVKITGCKLLCDLNNIYVSSHNHKFLMEKYFDSLPHDSICQFHLAGPSVKGDYLIDTHDSPVRKPVWELYELAIKKCPQVPTLLEWDTNIPAIEVLENELQIAKNIYFKNIRNSSTNNQSSESQNVAC
jgi:uncharacterized protein (UPF0276 family)